MRSNGNKSNKLVNMIGGGGGFWIYIFLLFLLVTCICGIVNVIFLKKFRKRTYLLHTADINFNWNHINQYTVREYFILSDDETSWGYDGDLLKFYDEDLRKYANRTYNSKVATIISGIISAVMFILLMGRIIK